MTAPRLDNEGQKGTDGDKYTHDAPSREPGPQTESPRRLPAWKFTPEPTGERPIYTGPVVRSAFPGVTGCDEVGCHAQPTRVVPRELLNALVPEVCGTWAFLF
jgi:hypothetical protein